jgi:hypothetical protein
MAGEELQRAVLEVLQQRQVDRVMRQCKFPAVAFEKLRVPTQQLVESTQRFKPIALHPGARLSKKTPVDDDAPHGWTLPSLTALSRRRRA